MSTPREELIGSLTGEWHRLGAELVLLSQGMADRLKINVTDLQCLAVLMSTGPMTAGQLAEAAALTTGAITGVVDRLEKAGLVQRESDPADRRRVVVSPLPREAFAARDPALKRALAGLNVAAAEQYESYSDRELELVIDALTRAHPVLLEQVSQLRDQPMARHELEAPRGDVRTGRLTLAFGLKMTVDGDPALTELYRAEVEGTPPQIQVDGGHVSVRPPRRFPLMGWGHRNLRLTLTAAIPWDIVVESGAMALNAELEKVLVRSFEIKGGASRITVQLGAPADVVPVRIAGGASRVTIRRPLYVPLSVYVKGGASKVTVDGRQLGPAKGVAWSTPGMSADAPRYEVEIRGGASNVAIEAT